MNDTQRRLRQEEDHQKAVDKHYLLCLLTTGILYLMLSNKGVPHGEAIFLSSSTIFGCNTIVAIFSGKTDIHIGERIVWGLLGIVSMGSALLFLGAI